MFELKYDIIIVGMGPSGIFCAYEMIRKNPDKTVLLIDQGRPVNLRDCTAEKIGPCLKCKPVCDASCGFSGSEAFSDGKLHLYHKSRFTRREQYVNIGEKENNSALSKYLTKRQFINLLEYTDNIFLNYGADEQINGLDFPEEISSLIEKAKAEKVNLIDIPVRHVGTENMRKMFLGIQNELAENENITLAYETKVEDLIIVEDLILGVICRENDSDPAERPEEILADKVILAVGKNGTPWFNELSKKYDIDMRKNEVEIGVRYELSNSVMNKVNNLLYEATFDSTVPPYYDRVRINSQNPGGYVLTEMHNDISVTSGHSFKRKKSRYTNLAILVTHKFCEPFDQSFEFIENIAKNLNLLANGNIIVQRLGDIYEGKRTWNFELEKNRIHPTLKSASPGDITLGLGYRTTTDLLNFINKIDKFIPGFANCNNLLYAPEIRLHKNKILLDKNFETTVRNLHCIGEGGGLTSNLILTCASGIHMARLIKKFYILKEEEEKEEEEEETKPRNKLKW